MRASKDIIRQWMLCMGVLDSILLGLPLRIELPKASGAKPFVAMIDTMKRTITLLGEEPMVSAVNATGRTYLTQALGELLLAEELIQFILHMEEEDPEKIESWRYEATGNLVDSASASLILASESL